MTDLPLRALAALCALTLAAPALAQEAQTEGTAQTQAPDAQAAETETQAEAGDAGAPGEESADSEAQVDASKAPAPLEKRGYALGAQSLGDPDAPVVLYEYASLTCGHCGAFHRETLPQLKEDYIDTGKLRLEFREVYFDQFGLWAGMISRCGGEGPYFGYVSTYYDQQQKWMRAEDIPSELMRIGRLGGLSQDRIKSCLSDEAFMRSLVTDFQKAAGADQITSTPTFILNGEKFEGNKPYKEISAWIDEKLTNN